jgi:mRNA interferase RelE/StbE
LKFTLVYTNRAYKDIQRLDQKEKHRIGKALKRYEIEPMKYATKLTDPKLGTYRFRIGDYRVIFDIEGEDVVILRIGHRRDIYRKL